MDAIKRAAEAVSNAKTLWIAAGAGMGVDSGLPDFRGDQGFWRAYPPLNGIPFEKMANAELFEYDPSLAWGFYGHRLHLYRETKPHRGFEILKQWSKQLDYFIYTSNVDGQFQKAGFPEEKISEIHGSIHWLQPLHPTRAQSPWSAESISIRVNMDSVRAKAPLPAKNGEILRPNILMFDDMTWLATRSSAQNERQKIWLQDKDISKMLVVEIGAGKAIPSIRRKSHFLLEKGASLVRINPRDSDGKTGTISIAMGGLEGLTRINEQLGLR